jgi:hypothetical protein
MEVAVKAMTIAVTAALFILFVSPVQAAGYSQPQTNVCLYTYLIDSTDTPDESTIVFHMKDGKTWANKLPRRCPGLRFHGFSYVVRGNNEICGNLQSIRVLETGNVCLLGPFVPSETKPPATDGASGG